MVGEPRCRGRSPRAGRGLSLLSQSFCEDSPRARQTVGAGKRLCDEIKKEGGRKTSEQVSRRAVLLSRLAYTGSRFQGSMGGFMYEEIIL